MPYDPSLPVDGSLIAAAELRGQFEGLATDINDRAFRPVGVSALGLTVSNPPTQAQVQAVADKVDELIAALNV